MNPVLERLDLDLGLSEPLGRPDQLGARDLELGQLALELRLVGHERHRGATLGRELAQRRRELVAQLVGRRGGRGGERGLELGKLTGDARGDLCRSRFGRLRTILGLVHAERLGLGVRGLRVRAR